MYHHDWVMRQIELMVDLIAKVVFKKDIEFNVYNENNSVEINRLYERLINLIDQNNFDEAENMLFEKVNTF